MSLDRGFVLRALFLFFLFGLSSMVRAEGPAAWTRSYRDLHETVGKISEQVSHGFSPEFMIIHGSDAIATIAIDSFAARVLKEAESVLQPYREGLQRCMENASPEYRSPKAFSFESFAEYLDNYVRVVVKAVGAQEDPAPTDGVRERRVTTDRDLYAYTKLLTAYFDERKEHFTDLAPEAYAADQAMVASLNDVARRVFHIDLTQKFDRKELLGKGMKSQPVFRDLASEHQAEIAAGLDPLAALTKVAVGEPTCHIVLPARKDRLAGSFP